MTKAQLRSGDVRPAEPAEFWLGKLTNDERNRVMSYEPTTSADFNDGFDFADDGTQTIIKGTKIKFLNTAEWEAGGEKISVERKFLAIEVLRVTQKWLDGRPTETRIIKPEEKFPDIDQLNAEAPQSEWRDMFGKKIGPWQRGYVLYLLDPISMAGFTFPTSTLGGERAVRELREAIFRARMLRGPNIFPLVTLGDVHMNTRFGGRQRPHFVIKEFVPIGAAPTGNVGNTEPGRIEPPRHPEHHDDRRAKQAPRKGGHDLNDSLDDLPWDAQPNTRR